MVQLLLGQSINQLHCQWRMNQQDILSRIGKKEKNSLYTTMVLFLIIIFLLRNIYCNLPLFLRYKGMCFLGNVRLKLISIIVVALGVGVGCCRSNKLILELVMGTCVRSLRKPLYLELTKTTCCLLPFNLLPIYHNLLSSKIYLPRPKQCASVLLLITLLEPTFLPPTSCHHYMLICSHAQKEVRNITYLIRILWHYVQILNNTVAGVSLNLTFGLELPIYLIWRYIPIVISKKKRRNWELT